MNYDIDYFIDKFSKIPEENWCAFYFVSGNRMCALGHSGARVYSSSLESIALLSILQKVESGTNSILVSDINDGLGGFEKLAPTPKQRILLALEVERDLRDWRE